MVDSRARWRKLLDAVDGVNAFDTDDESGKEDAGAHRKVSANNICPQTHHRKREHRTGASYKRSRCADIEFARLLV